MALLEPVDATGVWAAALGAAAVVLLLASVGTRRPPHHAISDLEGYLQRWQALHGGYDPMTGSVWLRRWLALAHAVGRPLARAGVAPDVLTLWTLWLTIAVVVAAAASGRWPLLAGAVLVVGGLGDAIDGCVAVLTNRTSPWGYVLDSLIDRVNDALAVVALVLLGAPIGVAVVCATAGFLLEYARARAGNAGGGVVGTITVGERANRVAFCAAGLVGAGAAPGSARVSVSVALWVLTGLSVAGLVQLLVALRRQLQHVRS